MPLPSSSMKACMHKAKKDHPNGRSKKKMSKEEAHKQRVAMCMNTVKESEKTMKKMNEMAVPHQGNRETSKMNPLVAAYDSRGDVIGFMNLQTLAHIYDFDMDEVNMVIRRGPMKVMTGEGDEITVEWRADEEPRMESQSIIALTGNMSFK